MANILLISPIYPWLYIVDHRYLPIFLSDDISYLYVVSTFSDTIYIPIFSSLIPIALKTRSFQHFTRSIIFPKFYLKTGFWKLCRHPMIDIKLFLFLFSFFFIFYSRLIFLVENLKARFWKLRMHHKWLT